MIKIFLRGAHFMAQVGVVVREEQVVRGTFLGWSVLSIKQFSSAKSLVSDDLAKVEEFSAKEGGDIRYFSRFAFENGEIECQETIHRDEVPHSPAYKKDGRWIVGIPSYLEGVNLSPGTD